MTAFLISVAKALICFVAICIGLGVLMLVWVVVREAAWIVKRENSKKYIEQEEKDNENGSI